MDLASAWVSCCKMLVLGCCSLWPLTKGSSNGDVTSDCVLFAVDRNDRGQFTSIIKTQMP